jgi:pyruvate/2-oxoglutarate/acetoin dehydrogenase E1 component
VSLIRNHRIRDAICQAIYEQMQIDPMVYSLGEGNHVKMMYDAPKLYEDFKDRIITLPISEDANVNFAVGASLLGVKPIVDIITSDFLFRVMDSVCNTAAKTELLYPGHTIVIRSEFFTAAPSCGQRIESIFTHIPGLNVVVPSYPDYAHFLMKKALTRPGVTLFFEDREIQDAEFEGYDSRQLIKSFNGDKLTIISYGLALRQVHRLINEHNLSGIDLIPLQTLYPLDWASIEAHVNHTGRCLIVEPDMSYMGIGSEISAFVGESCYALLERPVKRLGMRRSIIPASPINSSMQPSDSQVLETIRSMLE